MLSCVWQEGIITGVLTWRILSEFKKITNALSCVGLSPRRLFSVVYSKVLLYTINRQAHLLGVLLYRLGVLFVPCLCILFIRLRSLFPTFVLVPATVGNAIKTKLFPVVFTCNVRGPSFCWTDLLHGPASRTCFMVNLTGLPAWSLEASYIWCNPKNSDANQNLM